MFQAVQSPVIIAEEAGTTEDEMGTVNISKSNKLKSPHPQTVEEDVTSRLVTLFAISVVYPAYMYFIIPFDASI